MPVIQNELIFCMFFVLKILFQGLFSWNLWNFWLWKFAREMFIKYSKMICNKV